MPVVLPQCLLQVETGRCPHCLNCCIYCQHDACSKWRQGGARIIGLSDLCVYRRLPITILLQQCLLQVETGRCPHCLNCCIYCQHDACSKWRQGGARIIGLSDLCVYRRLPITILLQQCLLQMETGWCLHCLNCCMSCHHDACSKWRQGGARITVLSCSCTS